MAKNYTLKKHCIVYTFKANKHKKVDNKNVK